jgi:uncharacterized protein
MMLPFLNRRDEIRRLERAFAQAHSTLCCLFGRRRCGKSRLLREVVRDRKYVYYVGDRRNAVLQQNALARAMASVLEGFDRVQYPDWEVLLERWFDEAPPGTVMVLDEFPDLVQAEPAFPSLLQKMLDSRMDSGLHVVICGSSQSMMMGLVLDSSAPLYGRSTEILEIKPLDIEYTKDAFSVTSGRDILSLWSIWGGVPRYWELAASFPDRWEAVRELVLEPQGILHREPSRLLLDDFRETTQAESLLSVIGQGAHTVAKMSRRLNTPATSLSRPLKRLVSLGLITRDVPYGISDKKSKQSLYRITDPFLVFWFRYVEPHRSQLGAGQVFPVLRSIQDDFTSHEGLIFENIVREMISRKVIRGMSWRPGRRWWGRGTDGKPMELDVVSHSVDRKNLLVGEVKLSLPKKSIKRTIEGLLERISRFPLVGRVKVTPVLFYASEQLREEDERLVHFEQVVGELTASTGDGRCAP